MGIITEILSNPWVVAVTFYLIGYAACNKQYTMLLSRLEYEIDELNKDLAEQDDQINDLEIRSGIRELDSEFNGWADDEGLIEDINGEKFEA